MKKKIIFLSIFILVIIIGGVGIYYFTQSSKAPITFAETEAKYKTYTEPAPTDGSLPTDHDAYSNIAYVLWVLEHTEHYSSETRGSAVSVGQEQVIYNYRVVNGETQLVDTVSSGVVTLGKQKYFKDGKVLLRDYVSQDGDNITWQTAEPECISYNGYIQRYGWLPSQATGYIICKDTILEISEVKELEGGLYSIQLSLNPGDDYAPFWYRREVATNANSLSVPEFSSINIEYVFDATWHVQEVHTQEQYNVTPKVAPIKASCTTDITEKFDYEHYEFSSDAIDFFKQYENMVPVDGPVDVTNEETPLSYITGSLMGGNPEKTFQLKIQVKDKVITGNVLLNISDLNHIIVKAKFDDLFIVYDGDAVYLSYQDLKIKTTIEEATNLIKPLLEQMPSSNTENKTESSLDLAQIMNDINGAVVTKQDQNVQLEMTLNLGFVALPLTFDITEQENTLTLNSIESTIEVSGITANIHLNKADNVIFPTINETEFESLQSLEFIVDDLATILSNQLVGVKGQYVMDEQYRIDYDITINFNDPVQIQAFITIHDQVNQLNETIQIHFIDSMIYLNYQNIKIKFSLEEVEQLFGKHIEMPTIENQPIDVPTIVDKILSIDYAKLIQTISLKENQTHISLDLSAVKEDLSLVDLTIKNTENGFDLQMNSAVSIAILSKNITTISLNEEEYSPLHEYFEEIDYLLGLINQESIQLKLDGAIQLNETTTIGLDGEVYFYLKDQAYQIQGNLNVTYGDKNIEVGIVKIGQELYVELLGQTILIHLDNIEKTIQTIEEKMNLTMPTLSGSSSMDWNQLIQFISSVKIESHQISCDLSILKEGLGTCSLEFNLGQDLSCNLLIENLVSLNCTIGKCDYQEVAQPTVTLEDEDLIQLFNYVDNIEQILEKKQVSGTFTGTYEAYTLNGTFYVDFKEDLKAKVELNFITSQNTLPITVYYNGSSIYVEINEIKVKLTVEELMELIEKYASTENKSGLQDIVNDLDLTGMIESLKVENGNIEVVLTGLSKLINLMDRMTIQIERTPEEIKIYTDFYQIGLSINNQQSVEIEIVSENYQSLSDIKESIEYLLDRVYKKNLHVNVTGNYELTLTEQKELVEVNGDINLILNETNTYDIEADITLSIKGIDVRLVYINEKLYVTYEENTIGLTKTEIEEWLKPFMSQPISLEETSQDLIGMVIEVIQKIELRSGNEIRIDSSAWQIGMNEFLISLALGEKGLGITVQGDQLLSVEVLIDETPKELVEPVESLTNEDIKSYKEIVEYLLGLINQESMRIALPNGTISFTSNGQQEQILFNSTIDLMYLDHGYQMKADLHLEGFEYSGDITIIYKNHCIYLTLFGQNIQLPIDQLPEVLATIEEQFGLMFTMNEVDTNLDLSLLSVLIQTNGIELDLSKLIQTVCCISFSYQFQNETLNEELINRVLEGNLNVNYDHIEISLPYTLTKIETTEIIVPTNDILTITDILDWIKMAGYGWSLVKNGKMNVQIDPFDVVLKDGQKITISGGTDVILTQNVDQWSYQVDAALTFEGLGMEGSIRIVAIDDDIYLSVAGINVHLNLQNMNTFIQEIQEILKPMLPQMNGSMPTLEASGACINGIFSLVGHEFKVSLQPIFGELINLGLMMNLLTITDKDALDLQLNLEMSELVIEKLHMILTASNKTEILPLSNCLEAEELKELARTIVQAYELKDRKEFKFSIETNVITNDSKVAHLFGKIYLKLINQNEFDAKVDLEVTEFDSNGTQSAWHQVHLNIISLTTLQDSSATSGMMYGTYGNNEANKDAVIKIKSSYSGIEDLIASITELMNIDLGSSSILQTSSSTAFSLDDFIQRLQVSNSEITLSLNPMNLFPAMNETNAEIITLRIKKDAESIQGVEIDNLYLSYVYEDSTMKLDTLLLDFISDEMQLVVPTDTASYYDISNMSYLVEALYHNALEKSFRLQGNISLKALSFVEVKVPVDIQIKVKDTGEPDIYAFIDMSNIGIADNPLYRIATKKKIYVYYKDQFVYIYRDDVSGTANDAKIKIHYSEFMDNITYYLTDFAMGLHKDILDAMNKNDKKGDGFVDASLCVNNVEMTQNTFSFDLNMAEIGDNASLGNMVASLSADMVAETDENGNYILDENGTITMVPMITKLSKFNFNLVDVIDLNSTDLKLTNIVLDDQNNLVVQELDLATSSNFESYITEFDITKGYQSDTIYRIQNGQWIATSKVTHKAVFNMGDAGSVVMRYEEGNPVDFPYAVGDAIAVETEAGKKEYYLLDGWYTDASRLNAVTTDQVMANSSLYYYAKVHLATVALTITSDYVGNLEFVTYEGADITSLLSETYNIYTAENGAIYRFTGLTYSDGRAFDMTNVPLENATLNAHWELAQYDFCIQYGNDAPIVITKDDTSVILSESAAILVDDVYYIYSKEILTPQYLLTNYANQFVLQNEQFIMKLYNLDSLSTQDELFRMDFTAPEAFTASNQVYTGFFLRKDSSILASDLLPNEKDATRYFEINAWVDAQNTYYNWQTVNEIRKNIALTAYVSSISASSSTDSVFGYSETTGGLEISSLKIATLSTLIFPRFVHYNGEYKTITNIKEESFINSKGKSEFKSPFTGNTALQKIVFNDGLIKIGGNAFKNCTSLKEVYIPASVSEIASDAFYFTEGNDWGKNKYAQNLRLHFIYDDSQAKSFDYNTNQLLAFYDLLKNNYYGQSGLKDCIQENKQYLVNAVLSVIA